MHLLDTNTVIYFFKGEGGIADRLFELPPADVGLPSIVLFELEAGIAKSRASRRRRTQLTHLTSAVEIIPFGEAEARAAANVRADLEQAGTPIGALDTLIAGTALAANATLETRNGKEFGRVVGLKTENWYVDLD